MRNDSFFFSDLHIIIPRTHEARSTGQHMTKLKFFYSLPKGQNL